MRSKNNITSVIEIDYTSKSTRDRYRHFYKVLSSVNTPQQFIELIETIHKVCISNKDASLFFNYRTPRYKISEKFRVFIKDFDSEDIISIFKNALAISNSAHPSKNLYKVLLTDFFREYLNLLDGDAKKLMENIIKSKEFKYLPEDLQFQLKLKLSTVNNSIEGIESSSVASVNNITNILDELKSIDYTSKSTKARYRPFYKVLSSVNTPQQFIELIDAIRKTCISNKDAYLFFNYQTLRYKIGKKFRVFIKDFDSEDIISIFKNALAISNSAHPSKNLYKVFITDFFREYLNLLNGDAKKLMENIIKSKEFKYLPEDFQFQLKLKLSTVNHQENVEALPNLPVQLKRKLPTDIADKRSKKVAPNPVTTEVNNREKAKNCGDILAYIVAEEGIEEFGSVEGIASSSVASVNNITNILDELKSIDYASKSTHYRYRHFYKVLSSVNTPQQFIELIEAIHKVCSNNKDASHSFNNKILRYKIGERFRVFIKDFDSEDIISILKNAFAISTSAHPYSNLYKVFITDFFKECLNLLNGDAKKLMENIIKSKEFKYIPEDFQFQLQFKLYTINNQENVDALPNPPLRLKRKLPTEASVNNILDQLKLINYSSKDGRSQKYKYNAFYKVLSSVNTPQQFIELIEAIHKVCSNNKDASHSFNSKMLKHKIEKKFKVFIEYFTREDIISIFKNVLAISTSASYYHNLYKTLLNSFKKNMNSFCGDEQKLLKDIIKESSSVASVNNITNIPDKLKSIDYASEAKYNAFCEVISSVKTPQEFIELIETIHKVCSDNKDASLFFNYQISRRKIAKKFKVFIKDFHAEDIIYIFKNALAISTSAHPYKNLYSTLLDSFKKNINLFNGDKIKLTENIIKSKEFKYILKELKDVSPQLKRKLPTDIEDKCNKKVAPNPVTTEVHDQENADALPNLPSREESRSAEGTESSNNANSAEVSNQEKVAKEDSVTTGDLKQQENNNELLNFDYIENDILQDGQIYNNEDFLDNELLNSYAEPSCSLMSDNKEYCVW